MINNSPQTKVERRHIDKQECIPVGCVPSAAIAMSIPACTAQGGVCPRGVSAQGEGVCIPACAEAQTPLWTEFLTHTCENITLPQLCRGW